VRILRFLHPEKRTPSWGRFVDEETVEEISSPFGKETKTGGGCFSLAEIRLLPPVNPSKIVAVGLNYKEHIFELGHPVPENPIIFIKPSTSVIGPEEPILLPPSSQRVDYEAELAVVIKKRAFRIRREDAWGYILGYTCFNDVTARDLQKKDVQWTRSKSFDTFAPLGPWIEKDLDPTNCMVRCFVNGVLKQEGNTRSLLFPVDELLAFVSEIMTLLPGDVIATGTPQGVGPLKPSDIVEVEVEGVGILKNPVLLR
jgi:2-keto-4-pentenoate hydratase/2-oxohepta-3-ene-1,7-dioic acid hydratase in catechol pathway